MWGESFTGPRRSLCGSLKGKEPLLPLIWVAFSIKGQNRILVVSSAHDVIDQNGLRKILSLYKVSMMTQNQMATWVGSEWVKSEHSKDIFPGILFFSVYLYIFWRNGPMVNEWGKTWVKHQTDFLTAGLLRTIVCLLVYEAFLSFFFFFRGFLFF